MDCSSGAAPSTERVAEWKRVEHSRPEYFGGDDAGREFETRERRTEVRKDFNWDHKHNDCDVL